MLEEFYFPIYDTSRFIKGAQFSPAFSRFYLVAIVWRCFCNMLTCSFLISFSINIPNLSILAYLFSLTEKKIIISALPKRLSVSFSAEYKNRSSPQPKSLKHTIKYYKCFCFSRNLGSVTVYTLFNRLVTDF